MNTIYTARKITLRDSYKQATDKKLAKIEKLLPGESDATVVVTHEKDRFTVEITLRSGSFIHRAEATSDVLDDANDKVFDDLVRRIRRNKTRLEKKYRSPLPFSDFPDNTLPVEEETEFHIVRTKKFPIDVMSVDDAILQMNQLGHEFYMFRNLDSGEINVVYHRNDGDYALIEPV